MQSNYAMQRSSGKEETLTVIHIRRFARAFGASCIAVVITACATRPASPDQFDEAELIRQTEARRLRALVDADIKVARQLHADAFQLVNPAGGVLTKDQYLGAVEAGVVDYLVWEPETPIEVRRTGSAAAIRYGSRIEIIVAGQHHPLAHFWHTDTYEKLGDTWQVVWSQATEIR